MGEWALVGRWPAGLSDHHLLAIDYVEAAERGVGLLGSQTALQVVHAAGGGGLGGRGQGADRGGDKVVLDAGVEADVLDGAGRALAGQSEDGLPVGKVPAASVAVVGDARLGDVPGDDGGAVGCRAGVGRLDRGGAVLAVQPPEVTVTVFGREAYTFDDEVSIFRQTLFWPEAVTRSVLRRRLALILSAATRLGSPVVQSEQTKR